MPRKKSGSKAASGSTAKGNKNTKKHHADLNHVLSPPSSLPSKQHQTKYDWKDDVIRFYREEAITAWKCFLAASLERYILILDIQTLSKEVDIVREAMHISMTLDLSDEEKFHLGSVLDEEKNELFLSASRNESMAAKQFIYGIQDLDSGQSVTSLPPIDPKANIQHFLNLVEEGKLPTQHNTLEDDDLNLSFGSSTYSEDSACFLTARSSINGASPRESQPSSGVPVEQTSRRASTRVISSISNLDRNGIVKVTSKGAQEDLKAIMDNFKPWGDDCLMGAKSMIDLGEGIQNGVAAIPGVVSQGNHKKERKKSGTEPVVAGSKVRIENATTEVTNSLMDPEIGNATKILEDLATPECFKTKGCEVSGDITGAGVKGGTRVMSVSKGKRMKGVVNESAPDILPWMSQLSLPTKERKPNTSSGGKIGNRDSSHQSNKGTELSRTDSAIIKVVAAREGNATLNGTESSLAFPSIGSQSLGEALAPDKQIEEDKKLAWKLAKEWGSQAIGSDAKCENKSQSTEGSEVVIKKFEESSTSVGAELPSWATEGNSASGSNSVVPAVQPTRVKAKPFVKIPSLNKTSLCWYFEERGSCSWGLKCIHAHGKDELRPFPDWFVKASNKVQPHKYKAGDSNHKEPCEDQQCPARLHFYLRKTSVCKQWLAGKCRYTKAECKFAHGESELRKLPKHELCHRNIKKKCPVPANECVYAHSIAELRVDNSKLKELQDKSMAKGQKASTKQREVGEEDNKVWDCIICSDKIKTAWDRVVLDCGHDSFHKDCIEQWFQRDRSCPYCRKKVEVAVPFSAPRGAKASEYPSLAER